MQFNVATLLREPIGSTRHYALDADEPVHRGEVELIRTPGGILVRVHADVFLEATCSRCLAPFAYPVSLEFEEVYHQQVDLVTGRRMDAPDDQDAFLISALHIIDISEAVRQYSETAAAIQPLCRADCPGLCPVCGADLSTTSCSCNRAPVDPRWAALAALNRPQG